MSRPCPFVRCRHHLYLDVTSKGGIKVESKDPPWRMAQTCSLDVADKGPHTLDTLSELLGITRERVRQIEEVAMAKMSSFLDDAESENAKIRRRAIRSLRPAHTSKLSSKNMCSALGIDIKEIPWLQINWR